MEKALSKLCDSIRHSTTRYAVQRRTLQKIANVMDDRGAKRALNDCIACMDLEMDQIETALKRYCGEVSNGGGK